ncbi:hypothetical protein [Streptomyces sp. NBC_01716]|uniref:hypothetical protein n=1 Tax=Streptomyces sp. NBC_01716 TaxID=2975917 RepID=UPI002E3566C7|nr:hypothetical protein [Streptomyces sp. NBC_01716]
MVRLQVLTPNDWPLWRDARLAALTEAPHAFKSRVGDWHRGGEARWRARLETPGAYNVLASLKLAVIPGNSPAVSLYTRHGFVLAEERGDLLSDGVTREHVMVKAFR